MALVEEFDSGMASECDKSPEKKQIECDCIDDEPDETLAERLWGLTEMFPENVRNMTSVVIDATNDGVKSLYKVSRSVFWIMFSSSIILFAPVIFEVERCQLEEMQRNQQKQILLGPNTAVSGSPAPLMPPMHRS